MMLIGCCAPIEKYDLVSQSGFDYVEFPACQVEALSRDETIVLKDLLREEGVPCIRLNSYCTGIPAIAGDLCDDKKTLTYGEIAEEIAIEGGIPKMSAQAVGGALGRNKISIIIPCHRVIGANGNLTGYGSGIQRKIELLKLEGVDISRMFVPKQRSNKEGEMI